MANHGKLQVDHRSQTFMRDLVCSQRITERVLESMVLVTIFQFSWRPTSKSLCSIRCRLRISYLRMQPLSWKKQMSRMLPLRMPKCTGWQHSVFFTFSTTATGSDSLQSQRVIEPFMSLLTTNLELKEGFAIPFSRVLIHFDRPILHGSPESTNSFPSGKNSMSYAGGVMKLTLMGFWMRTSCSMMALETEITQGETGCAETAMGVDSWPLSAIDLLLVRLKRETSLWVQVRRTSLSNWSMSMTSVFWQGWNLLAYWQFLSAWLQRYCRMRPLEQPQKSVFSKDYTLFRTGGWLPMRRPLGQTISDGLGAWMTVYQSCIIIYSESAKMGFFHTLAHQSAYSPSFNFPKTSNGIFNVSIIHM